MYDGHLFGKESYYDELNKQQKLDMDKREKVIFAIVEGKEGVEGGSTHAYIWKGRRRVGGGGIEEGGLVRNDAVNTRTRTKTRTRHRNKKLKNLKQHCSPR